MAEPESFDDIFSEGVEAKEEPQPQPKPQPAATPKVEAAKPKETDDEMDDFFKDAPEEEAEPVPVASKPKATKKKEAPAPVPEVKTADDLDIDEMLADAPKAKIQSTRSSKRVLDAAENDDFDYSDEPNSSKTVTTIYGLKGEGKTTLYMSFPGTHLTLCFDRKAAAIKELMYNNDERIAVKDGRRYYVKESPALMLTSANITWKYLNGLLDTIEAAGEDNYPDWIDIDASDVFLKIAEMVMRFNNNLQPFQGFANLNIWKERRMYLDQLHNRCLELCKKGVNYTAYVDYEEIVEDGTTVSKTDVPSWVDAMMLETDVTIRAYAKFNKAGGISYWAKVCNSKRAYMKSGITVKVDGINGYDKIVEATEVAKQ